MTDINPSLHAFQDDYAAGNNQVVWVTLPSDMETPVSAMYKLTQTQPMSFLLESVTAGSQRGQYSVIGCKPDQIWRCRGTTPELNTRVRDVPDAFEPQTTDVLDSLRAFIENCAIKDGLPEGLPSMASGVFGYLGYDMVRHVEHLPDVNEDPLDLEDAILMRPTLIAILDHARDTITLVTSVWHDDTTTAQTAYAQACNRLETAMDALDKPVPKTQATAATALVDEQDAVSNMTQADYHAAVDTAKDYIRAGDIFQVVPSQRWAVPFELSPFSLYRALRRTNPSPYMTFFNFGHFQIVGASPEILVRVKGDEVTIRPIAGTRPRGATPAQDQAHADDLLQDQKELAEHLMLLDLGRNDVGRVSQIGTVHPTEQFTIERYSHVMHIVSNVVGTIKPEHDALSALLAGLPAGTVSGAPKIRAMEIIDELEPHKRGVYGGAVGYFSANGDMDTCIALRTSVVKDKTVYIQSGGGVVYDSSPEGEYQETVNKARALRAAVKAAYTFEAAEVKRHNQ